MSHYTEVLEEARNNATSTAKKYIPELYHILVDEEHKTSEDARGIIEHDLLEYWSRATVAKFLPQETKDEEKVKAGKQGAKATNLVLAGGQTVTTPSDGTDSVSPDGNDDEEPTPLELAEIKIKHLEEALKQTEQFKPASKLSTETPIIKTDDKELFEFLRKRDNAVTCFFYDGMGIEFFADKTLDFLRSKGVKTFKRLYFEV